jgi:hypothetical protein
MVMWLRESIYLSPLQKALRFTPYAFCFTPYALCFMPYALSLMLIQSED